MTRRLIAWTVAFSSIACGGQHTPLAPSSPPAPVIPPCQANHTAEISFRNNGTRTVDVIVDGGVLGILAPGESGLARTVAASVAHSIRFQITNTTINACGVFNPIPVECASQVYGTCNF